MQKDKKDKIAEIRNYIVKHCKIVFPIIVIVIVALTVSLALSANRAKNAEDNQASVEATKAPQENKEQEGDVSESAALEDTAPEAAPLAENTDDEIFSLVASYYNAMAMGDTDTLTAIFDSLSTDDMLRYAETAKYIDGYAALEIYTKKGLTENAVVACVYYKVCFLNHTEEIPGYRMLYLCRDEQGQLYIKNETNFTEEEEEYIKAVIAQDDVVEFNNRVNVEYNEMMLAQPELLEYLGELEKQVKKSIGEALETLGVALAEQNVGTEQPEGEENQEGGGEGDTEQPAQEPTVEEPSAEAGPQYAVATTTVNVRSSDSEKADKLGKVAGGTRVQVQEVRVNGWTKIVYEGQDGYIKSEYLQLEENTDGLEVIGTVTATTSINVRAAASQDSERLGLLAGGESLELLAIEDGWCKVKYNGRVAYVNSDYVTQQ